MRNRGHRVAFLLLMALFLLVSCTPRVKKTESGYVIRYCDIQAVYRFAASRDLTIKKLKAREINLLKVRKQVEEMQKVNPSNKIITKRLVGVNKQFLKLRAAKKSAKEKVMRSISSIIKEVAKESGADFVLNYGEGLLYGSRDYDVTEKVIRLYVKRIKRSAPVSR